MSSFGGVGKQLKILVYSFGIDFTHALRMAQDGHLVRFFTPWASAYPKFEDWVPGSGFESTGLTKVMEFFPNVEWADLIVCFDVGAGEILDYVRKTTNKPVFGSSVKGDKLENDRELMRALQGKMGMPVQKTKNIKGVPALREYIKRNPKQYIKISRFRADMESFYAESYDLCEGYLDHLEVALGPHNNTHTFMVEENIEDAAEPGYDLLFWGKDYCRPMLYGIEQSKESYVGVYMSELPKPLMSVAEKFQKILIRLQYRGAMSVEVKLKKDGTAYLLDVCSRYPFPLSAGYTYSIKNYSEVIWKIAQGQEVKLDVRGKYLVAMPIYSSEAENNYVRIQIPREYQDRILLRTATKVNGDIYGVKNSKVIGIVCDCGNNLDRTIESVKKMSDKIRAFKVSDEAKASLEKIEETLKELPKYGLTGFEKNDKYTFE